MYRTSSAWPFCEQLIRKNRLGVLHHTKDEEIYISHEPVPIGLSVNMYRGEGGKKSSLVCSYIDEKVKRA